MSILKNLPIALLVFGVIVVTGLSMIGDINQNYDDVNISPDHFNRTFNGSFNVIDNIYGDAVDQKDKIFGDGITEEETEASLLKGGFSALTIIPNSFTLFGNIINDAAQFLGIDSFYVRAALGALAIIVTLAIIFLVFRVVL